ncbi:MAG: hypothetical protein DSY60_03115 [Persephonella sp.]|nr:MAG: hypothetical protein DSY60_03115 [Persephonella sp.]
MKKVLTYFLLFFFLSSKIFALSLEDIRRAYYMSYRYEMAGDYRDAIRSLMVVFKSYPNGYTVNLRLGWLYYLSKKYSNSIFHYKKAIKVIPYSVEAKLGLTLPLLAQGKYSSVERLCYQILNQDFYNYYGNLRLVYVLRKQKKYDLAEKIINKMLYLYPTDTNFLLELGILKFEKREFNNAKRILNDVLILDPENLKAKLYLERIK